MPQKINKPLAELHCHLGSAVDPAIMWAIAHRQGIKLPSKNYWDFEDMITMSGKDKNRTLDEMHAHYFHWTELIQSSPEAIEESVKSVIGGGYRSSNIVLHELRFDPMLRNRGGERDLDHIIMSALWGLQRALLEYPQVKAGIILMMHRFHSFKQNKIIVQKAIKYKNQGVIGVDVAGPNRKSFSMQEHKVLFDMAKSSGLGITVHTGETGQLEEMRYVVREIKPARLGHGIECVKDKNLMQALAKQKIVLEICPTSNLRNSVIKDLKQMKDVLRTLLKNKIKFTVNTDGPEMYRTHIYNEQQLLLDNKILTPKEIQQCNKWAFEASFIK